MKKICPKCGKEKDARGFSIHINNCKGNLELIKDLPGLGITFGLMEDLNRERETVSQPEVIIPEGKGECNCVGYEGQSYTCSVHKAKVECPHCHCVGMERKRSYMEPITAYRCRMCGNSYRRNMISGAYLYR